MNKIAINMRGIHPTQSRPACLKDYQLYFAMKNGYAAAREAQGLEMHGVVHSISEKELAMLDVIEFLYVKELVEVVPYDGEKKLPAIKAYVYIFDPKMVEKYPEKFAENLPTERYIEILRQGAMYYGVDKTFQANHLENINVIPRKSINQLKTLKIADGALPEWTFEKMKEKDNEKEEIVFLSLNKKILRIDLLNLEEKNTKFIRIARGRELDFQLVSKYWYEPKYGVPTSADEMHDELRSYVEDVILEDVLVGEMINRYKAVALLSQ